jgi:sugar lactone lactonase YvrE
MNSTGTKLFVDMNNFNMLTIDVASRTITSTTPVGGTAQAMKMAQGDTLIYVGTVLGTVFEIDARTSAIRRQFNPTNTVQALDVSRDGKTLYTTNGTSIVTMTPLAAGGLSGTLDFGGTVNGVAVSPDGQQLWVGMNGQVFAAPFQDGTYLTFQTQSIIPVTGAVIGRIVFSPLGDYAVAVDIAGNNLVVIK